MKGILLLIICIEQGTVSVQVTPAVSFSLLLDLSSSMNTAGIFGLDIQHYVCLGACIYHFGRAEVSSKNRNLKESIHSQIMLNEIADTILVLSFIRYKISIININQGLKR